jgi:uncharacterized protein YjbJ (UPF0337 family)
MGFLDRLMGRGKKTAGDVTGDASLRSEGMHQEAKGAAEERADAAEQVAQDERQTAAEHEIKRDAES